MIKEEKKILKELSKLGKYKIIGESNYEVKINYYLLNFNFKNTNYPFYPPKLYICKKGTKIEYKSIFNNYYAKYQNFINEKLNTQSWCPCCSTITCMWMPNNTIEDMINEFLDFENKKNIIINSYILCRAEKFIDIIENNIFSFLVFKNILK